MTSSALQGCPYRGPGLEKGDVGGLDRRREGGASSCSVLAFILFRGVGNDFVKSLVCLAELGIVPGSGGNSIFDVFPKVCFKLTCCVNKFQ